MVSKFIKEGDRVEITAVNRRSMVGDVNKAFNSKISNIISDDEMEILMPMEATKLVLLPIDGQYNLVFYTAAGLYQCFATVTDRYKSGNIFLLKMELSSNLRKYQRREYYRFSCALEMASRDLEKGEVEELAATDKVNLDSTLPIRKAVVVDISGGGLRFMANVRYEVGSMIYCSYTLVRNGQQRRYELAGKVLGVRELENRPNTFEHRVQYFGIDEGVREEIIQFIFEEERRARKNK